MIKKFNDFKKEAKKRHVKNLMTKGPSPFDSINKTPTVLMILAILVTLFFGGVLWGKLLAGALLVAAIFVILRR